MKKAWMLSVAMVMLIALVGCAKNKAQLDHYEHVDQQQILTEAKAAFKNRDYNKSAEAYEALANYYPGTALGKHALLQAMYVHAKLKETAAVESLAEEFLHQYPRDKGADYAYYLNSVAPLFEHSGFLQRVVHADPSLRGADLMKKSYKRLRAMLRLYPHSQYIGQAQQLLVRLKHMIAAHNVDVARYYYSRGAYQAAINRAMDAVSITLSEKTAQPAFVIMRNSYRQLGQVSEAKKIDYVLKFNQRKSLTSSRT